MSGLIQRSIRSQLATWGNIGSIFEEEEGETNEQYTAPPETF